MKKLLFIILPILFALNANALITVTCPNTHDYCSIDNSDGDTVHTVTKCQELNSLDVPVLLPHSLLTQCSTTFKQIKCDYGINYIGSNNDLLVFCNSKRPNIIYMSKETQSESFKWPYAEKQCRGSGGNWIGGKCKCPSGTDTIGNECVCKDGNTPYPFTDDKSCQEVGCGATGGINPTDCQCIAPNTELDPEHNWCKCKNGYRFRDPTRKWEGCVSIKDSNINISGTVKDTTSTLPSATISWYDDNGQPKGTITDNDGRFSETVPNTAYVTFSFTGHQPNTFAATDLTSNQEIVLYSDNVLDEIVITPDSPVELPESSDTTALDLSECENSGGTHNAGDTKCTCTGVLEETIQTYNGKQYSICKCVTGYKRENGKYKDKCVDAGDTVTEQVLDTEKMRAQAEAAYQSARDHEQSIANRALTAGTTLTTGAGAMAAASALAEQKADRKAEADMRDYLATFKCEYGNGQQQNAGNEEITLPGGNELLEYYTEYKTLADNVKQTKGALGLRAGIESETLYDRAQTGLYQYSTAARTSTGQISLARALSDETSADATAWNEQKAQTRTQLNAGLVATATGVVGGIVGNQLINRKYRPEELKDEFKEITTRLEKDYGQTFTPTIVTPVKETKEEIEEVKEDHEPEPETPEIIEFGQLKATAFKPGSIELNEKGEQTVKYGAEGINDVMKDHPDLHIKIIATGHTDHDDLTQNTKNKLQREYGKYVDGKNITDNPTLSKARAMKVLEFLKEQITDNAISNRITMEALGKGDDYCPQDQPKNKYSECRHVDVTIEIL